MERDWDLDTPQLVRSALVATGVAFAGLTLFEMYLWWVVRSIFEPSFVAGVLLSLPAAGVLILGGYWLPRTEIPERDYRHLGMWSLAGTVVLGVFSAITGFALFPDIIWARIGSIRWGSSVGAGIGFLIAFLATRAIERRVAVERASIRATEAEDKQEILEYLNALLRHEVLNTNSVINGYARLIESEAEGDETTQEHAEVIQRQTEEVSSVIEDVRFLLETGGTDPELRPVELRSVLETELQKIRDRHGTVETNIDAPQEIRVMADRLIRRMFSNLLQNAIDHNPRDPKRVSVSVSHTGDTVAVEVEDNGPGIPEDEREDVKAEMASVEDDIEAKNEEIEGLEAEIEELEQELADSDIPELTSKAEEIREEISDLEDRMDDLDGDLNELELEKQYAEEAIEELHDDIETAQNRKAEAEDRVVELEEAIADEEEKLEAKEEAVAELEDELSELKGEREELKGELADAKAARDEQKERVSRVESKLADIEEKLERLEWEIDELSSQVGEYDPEEIPDHETVTSEIARLEAEMTALEPVNMKAIDEYDRVAEELDDLEEKRDTLVEEADGIRERIDAYEARKKETFMEAYEGINEQFEDIFARLSSGSGELVLEDPEDPFEGGLTMKAQPGDKPVQRLDAMSGGEKSLTALAFIFAIQRYNPAPFYALDEVDAFLDAANAEMVGEMVEELAGDAQFVVVSHRSALLERSERAIGVMMQDENVSAVTGIDLSSGEVPADD